LSDPIYHARRCSKTEVQLNPKPYLALYAGHKLHIDQNEKLVMYGVTHICAIDGYSGKIVAFCSMPIKNNVQIYSTLFRPLLLNYGIWDEVRVDQGKEWVLMLFVQECLANLRTNTTRPPHLQSTSKQNHAVERMWVEINKRVNYPVKKVLVAMQNEGLILTENQLSPLHCFCVSWFTLRVVQEGLSLAIAAWNNHTIPGKGKPDVLYQTKSVLEPVQPNDVPTVDEAVAGFQAKGGRLTLFSSFGVDPLEGRDDLCQIRIRNFHERFNNFSSIFHSVCNEDDTLFRSGLLHFINITTRLSSSV
jgi:hypothetical protein